MAKQKLEFLVIGLGRFGQAVCERLQHHGHSVLGVDSEQKIVQEVSSWLPHVIIMDATDKQALEKIEATQFDVAIVAIGSHFEASILITVALKELGVKKVIAKALTSTHERVLLKVGADEVIYPERQAGHNLADEFSSGK